MAAEAEVAAVPASEAEVPATSAIPPAVVAAPVAVPPTLIPTTIAADVAALPAEPLDALAAMLGLAAVEAVAPDVAAQLKLFALQAVEAMVGAGSASAGEQHSHAQ